jgi:hypothetical protein
MNWKECARLTEQHLPGSRFLWPEGGAENLDCTSGLTISDVWGAVAWAWTWPGDWILSQEPLRTFFEIEGTSAVGTIGSNLFAWFAVFCVLNILGGVLTGR